MEERRNGILRILLTQIKNLATKKEKFRYLRNERTVINNSANDGEKLVVIEGFALLSDHCLKPCQTRVALHVQKRWMRVSLVFRQGVRQGIFF